MNNETQPHTTPVEETQGIVSKIPKKMISIKTAIIIAVILILAAIAYYSRGWFIAATVNGSPISRSKVVDILEKQTGKQVLENLVTEKLIEQEAHNKGVVISDEEVATELKKLEDQIKANGNTLDAVLGAQGLTLDDLKKQIVIQKQVEKILADKTVVTDAEVEKYITDNKVTMEKGKEAAYKAELKTQLQSQKLNTEAQQWLSELRTQAKIKYYVNY